MEDSKLIIKDDINFLENPNWIISERGKTKVHTLEKGKGKYEIKSIEGLPNRFDKIVLYCLLYKLNELENNCDSIITTRYDIAKNIFYKTTTMSKANYARIILALEKWKALSIKFEGIFYEGDNYTYRLFSVLDDVILNKETNELYIKFNQQYLKQIRESKFYKLIDFKEYRELTRPISARLYEILIKTFKERDNWYIDIKNLAEKLTLEKRPYRENYFPSDVLIKLRPGINEINKKTKLKIDFSYDAIREVCIFKKIDLITQKQQVINPLLQILISLGISSNKAQEYIENYSEERIKHKIDLLKQSNQAIRNVTAWFTKALKHDWDSQVYNKEIEKQKIKQEKIIKQKQEEENKKNLDQLKNEFENYKQIQALSIFNSLPELLQQNLEDQFQQKLKNYGPGPVGVENFRASFLAAILIKKEDQDFNSWLRKNKNLSIEI